MQNPEQSEQPAAPTDFPEYPAYKPSDVQWLGDIPSHWEVRRLKYLARNISQPTSERVEGELRLGLEHVESWTGKYKIAENVRFESKMKRFQPDDVLFGKLRPYLAKVTRPDRAGLCMGDFLVFRSKSNIMVAGFLEYLLRCKYVIDLIDSSAVGAKMPRADWNFIGNVWLPLPPLPEQRAIAAYLDRKGAIARRYAHVARHIIDNLRELRQVEIHDAVTRGLNEDIPLKPSGVQWLGDVPEHWDVRRLKYSAKTIMGQSPSGYDCDETPIGPPFLQGCAEFQERHPKPVLYCRAPKKISPTGAILLSVRAPVGRLNIADQEYAIGRGLCAIIPDNKNLDTTFAYYHLQAVTTGLRLASTGSIFDAVRLRDVRNQPIITPPLPEQRVIADYLDAKTAAIDAAIAHYERMAELVAEYWTVLVADAVTGRIDLRQEAAPPE